MPAIFHIVARLCHQRGIAVPSLWQWCATTMAQSCHYEGKTYTEIALEKQISVKTVEAYMTKALKFLRVELKDYLPMLIVFID